MKFLFVADGVFTLCICNEIVGNSRSYRHFSPIGQESWKNDVYSGVAAGALNPKKSGLE